MNTTVNKPKMPLLVKIILILIPIAIFGYLITVNFLINQEFNYFYDIGGEEDALRPYLGPINRTSDIIYSDNEDYRNINHRLIYFSIPYTKGSDSLLVSLNFLTELNKSFSLGIKNDIGWNYTWIPFDNYLSQENNWIIAEQLFSLENSYLENNKLSLSLDILELSRNPENKTFFIDWINITVYKPGVFS